MNLQPFCSTWNTKYKVPWSRGEYTFATDGGIIVRVPKVADIPDNFDSPDALRLWAKIEIGNLEWTSDIPELPAPEWVDCEDCQGEEPEAVKFCEECAGTGKVLNTQNIIVGGMTYADKYLRLIKDLPGYKFYPVQYDFSRGNNALPSPFTFEGGDGLLMPVKT